MDWGVLATGVAGGYLGARLTGRASEETLRRAIGIALLAVAAAFAVEAALR